LNNESGACAIPGVGNLRSTTLGVSQDPAYNRVKTAYQYDQRNRLTDMAVTRNVEIPQSPPTTPQPVASFNYNPDPNDPVRRLGRTGIRRVAVESFSAQATINREVRYSYDPLYRLTAEALVSGSPNGTITYDALSGYGDTDGYGYDKVGNRRSRTSDVAGVSPYSGQKFDQRDRLDQDIYTENPNPDYDQNGNTLRGAVSPAQTADDVYDAENRLITRRTTINSQPSTITLVYDGDGNRVSKIVTPDGGTAQTTDYIVDDLNPTGYAQVLAEIQTYEGDLRIMRRYLYGHTLITQDRLIAPATRETDFYGYDGHGNVRFLMDSTGQITDGYTYDAFGILIESRVRDGSGQLVVVAFDSVLLTPNSYKYCAQHFDSDLGLYYNRARYMNPGAGRFWTLDKHEGDSEQPPSLHKYLYCGDDPVNLTDPTGNDFSMFALLNAFSISGMLFAKNEIPLKPQSLAGRNVDVYVWRWRSGGVIGHGSRVGHVMITKAGTKHVYQSQFPYPFGARPRVEGDNTKYDWAQTVTAEESAPDNVFRVHLPNGAAFDAAVRDHVSRKTWTAKPKTRDETHCARAGYDLLKAGGLPVRGEDTGQVFPGTLGNILENLAKTPAPNGATWSIKAMPTDYNKIITR
jgi:RHS repeat-associated protein